MNNKVYGFCDAGCKYEVPSKEEFEEVKVDTVSNAQFEELSEQVRQIYFMITDKFREKNDARKSLTVDDLKALGGEQTQYGPVIYDKNNSDTCVNLQSIMQDKKHTDVIGISGSIMNPDDIVSSFEFSCFWDTVSASSCNARITTELNIYNLISFSITLDANNKLHVHSPNIKTFNEVSVVDIDKLALYSLHIYYI